MRVTGPMYQQMDWLIRPWKMIRWKRSGKYICVGAYWNSPVQTPEQQEAHAKIHTVKT